MQEAEKVCPCCRTPRVKIGEETSEQLDYRPAKLFVREHVRLKYACPTCAKAAAKPLPTVPAPVEAASETCAYYAYYYGYLAYYYAFTDYVGSGNASTGAYDAFYYGYYDWNNSYNVAIGN